MYQIYLNKINEEITGFLNPSVLCEWVAGKESLVYFENLMQEQKPVNSDRIDYGIELNDTNIKTIKGHMKELMELYGYRKLTADNDLVEFKIFIPFERDGRYLAGSVLSITYTFGSGNRKYISIKTNPVSTSPGEARSRFNSRAAKRLSEDRKLLEKAPPGMENWIKKHKQEFKDRYSNDWSEKLYATAWKIYNQKNENVNEVMGDIQGLEKGSDPIIKLGKKEGFRFKKVMNEVIKRLEKTKSLIENEDYQKAYSTFDNYQKAVDDLLEALDMVQKKIDYNKNKRI